MFKHERPYIQAAFYWDYTADNGHYVNFIELIYTIAANNDETTCDFVNANVKFPNNYIAYKSFEIKYHYALNIFNVFAFH